MMTVEKFRIDLQLFAAEDEGRTEPASERRRREERDKGNVPKSQELTSTLVMIGGASVLYLLSSYLFEKSGSIFRKYLSGIGSIQEFSIESFGRLFSTASKDVFFLLLPILSVTVLFAILGNVLQVGLMFAPRALGFKFNRIAPNFKKVIPSRQTMFNLGKSLLKVAIIGVVAYFIISHDFLKLLLLGDMGLKKALGLVAFSGFKLFFFIGILLLVIGVLDFIYQKYEYEESLKQTPSEAKQELKADTGNMEFKSRRRQMAREIINRGSISNVTKADVVITNPTHFAVALAYTIGVHPAPIVVAKGEDQIALAIRRVARENEITIVENRELARMLYKETELNEPIPEKFFAAVSIIITRLEKFQRVRQ